MARPSASWPIRGYARISRAWRAGDVIDFGLPMPVRRIVANEQVAADRGRVALQRGPVVFAVEWPDNPGGRVRNLVLDDEQPLLSEFRPGLLGGVQVITGRATVYSLSASGARSSVPQPFTAIPYFAWANRGRGEMAVWLARTGAVVRPTPAPTLATTATVTTSPSRRLALFINDGEEPASSDDPAMYFDWWPTKGTTEWAELTLAETLAGLGGRGLLVRRYRPGAGARARRVACAVSQRRCVGAGHDG